MVDKQKLRAALEHSRSPWTVTAVRERVADPNKLKTRSSLCAPCDAPCTVGEVCVAAVADDTDLLDQVGRDRAFRLVEGGVERLKLQSEIDFREAGGTRPNTFISSE